MISAVIITLNEEQHIERCIRSVQGLVSEVLVYDSGSTDRTAEVARSLGARVVHGEWLGFAATKNLANGLVKGAYVLSLDADEWLSDELRESIAALSSDLSGCYSFHRLNSVCGKWVRHGGWYPDTKVRLFPAYIPWEGEGSHEKPQTGNEPVHLLQGDLLHESYRTEDELFAKAEKYAALAAEVLKNKPVWYLLLKRATAPEARWLRNYIFRLGFLDGRVGLLVIRAAMYEAEMKYRLALQRKRAVNKP